MNTLRPANTETLDSDIHDWERPSVAVSRSWLPQCLARDVFASTRTQTRRCPGRTRSHCCGGPSSFIWVIGLLISMGPGQLTVGFGQAYHEAYSLASHGETDETMANAVVLPRIVPPEAKPGLPLQRNMNDATRDDLASDTAASQGRFFPRSSTSDVDIVPILKSLSLVLGMFLGFVWLLRKLQTSKSRHGSSIACQIVGEFQITRGHRGLVLQVFDRLVIVSESKAGLQTLFEINDAQEIESICQRGAVAKTTPTRSLHREPAMADSLIGRRLGDVLNDPSLITLARTP